MTRISATTNPSLLSATGASAGPATPAEALRRLNLRGEAGREWTDVVRLDAPGVATVARALDDEREALETAYQRGTRAAEALAKIDALLAEAQDLAKANERRGAGRRTRRDNQKKIDALLAEVETTADDAKLDGVKLLDGRAVLAAGKGSPNAQSLELDRIGLPTLGRLTIDGHSVSLDDVTIGGALDATDGRASALAAARRSLETARDSVTALRERITTFQRDALRPRLGDVATAMEGLFTSTSLGGSDAALQTARELRQMTLASATIATAIAADGWDRERALALLT